MPWNIAEKTPVENRGWLSTGGDLNPCSIAPLLPLSYHSCRRTWHWSH